MSEPIGIIAGDGMLPTMVARGIRAAGHRVVAAGMTGQYRDDFPAECDEFVRVGVLRVGEWARKLRRRGVSRAIMVGGVDKASLMYMPFWKRMLVMRPDWIVAKLWYRVLRHDKRSQTLLTAVANELSRAGLELMDSTRYIPDHMSHEGVMTDRQPTASQRDDIAFGWPILMNMNDLEIGQAIAVRDHDVVAVEAVEGTDAMIRRAGELAGHRSKKEDGGWTLLKGAGEKKDLRFDVPTIGLQTIEGLKAAGAGCLAVDAGRVIFIEKEKVLAAADAAGIAIVGVKDPEASERPAT
ncbi:MAG: UDP-2,3-diacylglucosamine diphosphatase LpxI [Planctomycetota bacterium]